MQRVLVLECILHIDHKRMVDSSLFVAAGQQRAKRDCRTSGEGATGLLYQNIALVEDQLLAVPLRDLLLAHRLARIHRSVYRATGQNWVGGDLQKLWVGDLQKLRRKALHYVLCVLLADGEDFAKATFAQHAQELEVVGRHRPLPVQTKRQQPAQNAI